MLICQHCPILCDYPAEQHAEAFERFLQYKTRVPVRGAIMLNEAMDAVVLVKGWKKNANWSFPRGKINKEEPDLTCAVREVYEETGYDLQAAGLVGDGEETKSIEISMREQSLKLFVFRGVPMDTHFEPRTRKEISKIQWYKLQELPTIKKKGQQQEEKGEGLATNANKFYMVAPFLGYLKKWISQQKKLDKANPTHRATIQHQPEAPAPPDIEELIVEEGTGTRGDIDKLLDSHRRRKQKGAQHKAPQEPSDLPEVSSMVAQPDEIPPLMQIDTSHNADRLNKVDLLAILKGTKTLGQDPPPQTPAAQMIDEPIMPHSPPHHHLSRMPTLPLAPTLMGNQSQPRDAENEPGKVLSSEAISAAESERSAPQTRHLNSNGTKALERERLPVLAPYQKPDHNSISMNSQTSIQGPAVPPASNLPKPILTQQKASLLSLFKQINHAPNPVISDTLPKVPSSTPTSSLAFVPPQILPRSSTAMPSTAQSMSNQKANLLAMFKTSPAPKTDMTQDKASLLQTPSQPIELSAFPSPGPSPGHSRVQSRTKPEPQNLHVDSDVGKGRHTHQASSTQSPPTSATISGPLNIPQFDMIAKHHREVKDTKQRNEVNSHHSHSVTILPRPGKHDSAATLIPSPPRQVSTGSGIKAAPQPTDPSRRKEKPVYRKQILTPVKTSQPPAPTLEAQSTPTKQFHPQILKRPTHLLHESDNMSPIQPLPSPKHAIMGHKAPQKTPLASSDHKKSLLSLFSAPSPIVSPPSGTPEVGNGLASIVSPLSEHHGMNSGLERKPSWKENQLYPQLEPSRSSSITAVIKPEIKAKSGDLQTGDVNRELDEQTAGLSNPVNGNDQEPEPQATRNTKETPDELKNLLLGRLANIKF